MDEKPEKRARKGEGHSSHHGVARQKEVDAHEQGRDRSHTACQAIHIVQQVERVRDSDEPEEGNHHVDDIDSGQPDADPAHDEHRGRRELADQLGAGSQLDEIVDEADREDHDGRQE